MRSMSGSRRNSGSSLVSSSSASSNLSHLEEDTWILWGRIVNEWDEWRRKKDKLLKVIDWSFFVQNLNDNVLTHIIDTRQKDLKHVHSSLIFCLTLPLSAGANKERHSSSFPSNRLAVIM